MKEIFEGGISINTSYGSHVGVYMGAPDTVVIVLQRTLEDNETRTTTVPMGREAFFTLLALGGRFKEILETREKAAEEKMKEAING